jgi:hypothetical protein
VKTRSYGSGQALTEQAFYHAIEEITDELDSQTDRGAAIVGVALLDDRLRQAIESSLDSSLSRQDRVDLFEGPTAPIGTYSARARLARALGLFGDDYLGDLKPMREAQARNAAVSSAFARRMRHPASTNR